MLQEHQLASSEGVTPPADSVGLKWLSISMINVLGDTVDEDQLPISSNGPALASQVHIINIIYYYHTINLYKKQNLGFMLDHS